MKNFATKAERTKAVKLLKNARERIEQHRNDWVCTAISNSAYDLSLSGGGFKFANRIAERLRRNISKSLEGHAYVDHWLAQKKNIPARDLTKDAVRAYRLRWIDSMIAQLEAM